MMFDTCKPVIKFQTALGGVQCILFAASLGSILGTLQKYHDSDRLNFNCHPKPSAFIRQRCYNSYISTVTKPHGLIPRNVVAITLGVLCACWISFAIYGAVTLRKRPGDRKDTKKFLCTYLIHVFFRILFLGVMVGLVCSYQTISLPSVFECDVNQILQTNSQTTPSPLNQTKLTLQCNDLHHKEKSNLNIVFISVGAFFMVFSVWEVLHLCRNRKNYLEKLVGDPEDIELPQSLPEKPIITNTKTEVDEDFIITWSEAEANRSNSSVKYRLEWRKQPMTGSTEMVQRENIVGTHLKITGLEYDAEYEVKLFAVNEQGDSEPDVRTFKTKSAISRYTKYLQASVLSQTEFQPKLLASRTISNAKTDEIFTNLLIQHGRKALIRKDETYYSRSEELKYYGKVSGTPVKYSSEIFLGVIDDQESASSILVVGKAGIGKSLFCQKVIRDWANNELFQARENTEIPNLKFVYLLSFRQLNLLENNCVTLREILNWSSVLNDKCNIDDSTFEYIVKHPKQVMIILDGFDEYSQQNYIIENLEAYPNDAKSKMPVAALCSKLIKGKILRGAIVMITSRPDESDKMGGMLFKRYVEIVGFSSGQVKEYIEKYFKDNENMKNAVLKHVMNNSDLVSFAHIPMLCYLLRFEMEYTLTESGNPDDLPVSTTDIYTKLVDIFELKHCAESEYRQKEIPEQFEPPSVIKNTLEKLSKLAAKLLLERKPTFDESEMEGNFEAEEVNKLKGSGLLYCGQPFRTASITTTKNFSFTHLTVQEFLAARWFVKENCVPDEKCSKMFYQFMAGVLSSEGNDELMDKLLDSHHMNSSLKMKCLIEYQNKEFAKKFIKNNPLMFSNSLGFMFLHDLSDEKCIEVSFVLDIISELNKEEAGEAQHKCSDKFVTVKKLEIRRSLLTLSGIQRFCNSLNNEHCLVSELVLCEINLSEYVSVLNRLVRKLTTLYLESNRITDSGVASLCEALQHPSCRLTRLELYEMKITKNGFASLGEALQHPSCKLTTLYLRYISITDTTVASLCKALQHPSCKLTTLYLGHNSLTDISAASLCKALQHPSCKLTSLNLDNSMTTDNAFASLCEALQHPSCKLTTLYLKHLLEIDNNVASLCEALHHPSSKLTTLYLECLRSSATDTIVSSLCEALQHPSCKLTTLYLGFKSITDTTVSILCEALQHPSCKLTTLILPVMFEYECRASLEVITQRHQPALKLSFVEFVKP